MPLFGIPGWVLVFSVLVLLACAALVLVLAWGLVKPRPRRSLTHGGASLELWVRRRRYPGSSDAVVVPVGSNLKLSTGIGKWVRDATAGKAQWEADAAAPLPAGSALRVAGGRYRFGAAVLAVVMGDGNLADYETVTRAIAESLRAAAKGGAQTCVVPDMTEDLLRQPQWITDAQRRETCRPVARATLEGIAAAQGAVPTVRIWAWHPATVDVWLEEFARLETAGGAATAAVAHA